MITRQWSLHVLLIALTLGLPIRSSAQVSEDHYVLLTEGASAVDLASIVAEAGGTLLRVHPEIGMATATSADPNFASTMEASLAIDSVSQDLMLAANPPGLDAASAQPSGISGVSHFTQFPPEDAQFFFAQWNMLQIGAPSAWASGHFGEGIKVAVLDSGTDPTHIDLFDKIDLAQSTSFVSTGTSPCGPTDEGTILDFNGHGTLTSGVITSNNFGTAGVAPLSTIVAIKVLNCGSLGIPSPPSGLASDIIAGLLYAASLNDVDVINMSLAGIFDRHELHELATLSPEFRPEVILGALNAAVNQAGESGKLVVTAAGNNAINMDQNRDQIVVPAESGSAISIYATNIADMLASYSNHGISGTWIGAPGGEGTNGILGPCSHYITYLPTCALGHFFVSAAGTSFAAPAVAGAAALVQSASTQELGPGRLKAILSQSADDLGAPGTDNIFSHGRLNAGRAVN